MLAEVAPIAEPTRVRFAPHSAFSRELKRRADAYFEGGGGRRRRDLPGMYLKSVIILSWWVGSWAMLVFWAREPWQAVLLAVSLGLSIAGIGMSIQHDANHGGYSSYPIVNRLFRLSLDAQGVASFIWRQKHNTYHHTYTNIEGVDFDLDFGVIARLSPDQVRRVGHRYQHFYLWFLYGFLLPKWVLRDDWGHLFTQRAGPHKLHKPSRGDLAVFAGGKLFFLAWAVVIPALYHPLWQVLLFLLLAVFTLGVTLSAVFQLAHCVEEAEFPRAPTCGEPLPCDVAVHQVETAADFGRSNWLLTWYLGGLNFQVEHHLFPKVCHLHYPALSRIVEEVAAEHGVRYRSYPTLMRALKAHFDWLRKMGQPVEVPAAESVVLP